MHSFFFNIQNFEMLIFHDLGVGKKCLNVSLEVSHEECTYAGPIDARKKISHKCV